jgi:CelD/BcsL family acetyltransferase involved in cellulose biosynthesis
MRMIIDPWRDRAAVVAIWTALAAVSRPRYFLSWAWVENWLATLPRTTGLKLVALVDQHGPQAAWFIGKRVVLHGGVIPSRARFLNATGWEEFDELTIEHNGWLARTPLSCTLDHVIDALEPGWDEFVLSAMAQDRATIAPPSLAGISRVRAVACHGVDLAKVRAAPDYLTLIGGETRSQIRRARKLYEQRGPLVVEIAGDLARAREIFHELVALHTAAWAQRGGPGAFSPYMIRFHARLIERRLAHGEIQLVRVRAGDSTIGCLYNLVHDRIISFYQSGFAYEPDNRLKPGLVCHAEAIRYNAAIGNRLYDFLGGEARYKRSLATDTTELTTYTIRRPCVRFALENQARSLLERWRKLAADRDAASEHYLDP